MSETDTIRPLRAIAKEIARNWPNPYYAAKPYLNAMMELDKVNDRYGMDSARSIVLYFLSNAGTWRGAVAKRIKTELKRML